MEIKTKLFEAKTSDELPSICHSEISSLEKDGMHIVGVNYLPSYLHEEGVSRGIISYCKKPDPKVEEPATESLNESDTEESVEEESSGEVKVSVKKTKAKKA